MSRRSPAIRPEPVEAQPLPAKQAAVPTDSRYLVPWLLLFAGSGCAALIYEIVWFQLLQLVIGSSAVSLGLLLAAYMGGLCAGSAAFSRLVSARRHPMRVYAYLELGIAAFGVIALWGIPLVAHIYVAGPTSGLPGLIGRGVIAVACLLPPTLLMGGSLPAIARWVEVSPKGVSRLGLLYSANVAGAVVGCLLAGFYLLRVHDMAVATYLAAAINIAVALLALGLAARTPTGGTLVPASTRALRSRGVTLVYVTIGLSGLTALGAEVVWTRLLSLLLGATVYTFSIILAVFLLGLWAGSLAGSFLSRRVAQPRLALAACQILLAAAIAYTAFTLAYILPYWPVDPRISLSPWFNFDLDLTRTIKAILPATLLWGASFPLAFAGAAAKDEDPGRLAGEVYAANTAGSIVGALAFSLLFIPQIGTRGSQQLLTCLAAAAGLVALGAFRVAINPRPRRAYAAAVVVGVAMVAWGLSATISDVPWQVTAYGRRVASVLRGLDLTTNTEEQPLFVGEGINSSVVITERADQRFFYVSGKSEASSAPLDMRLQRMMGNIPALVHPAPRSVLVIGFGAGVTAGSFVPYPEVRNILICELEPMIPPASGQYFSKENYSVTRDGRAHIIEDDARHFILTAAEKFDIITTDPIHPWVKGTSTLYSKEFFELEKSRLNPGGVVAQWLPLYESDEATVKTQLATFFAVFPNATVWSNYANGDGYDLVLIGSENPAPINIDAVAARLAQDRYSGVAASLAEVGFPSAVELLGSYTGRAADLQPMLTNVPLNEDLTMRLQYLAGMGLNLQIAPQIYRDILAYRRFPEDLIAGTGDRINALRVLIGRRHRSF